MTWRTHHNREPVILLQQGKDLQRREPVVTFQLWHLTVCHLCVLAQRFQTLENQNQIIFLQRSSATSNCLHICTSLFILHLHLNKISISILYAVPVVPSVLCSINLQCIIAHEVISIYDTTVSFQERDTERLRWQPALLQRLDVSFFYKAQICGVHMEKQK